MADTRRVETLAQGGLSVGEGRLYVAETNDHAIRWVDLEMGEVATLEVEGL